jgi:hypothetical protein
MSFLRRHPKLLALNAALLAGLAFAALMPRAADAQPGANPQAGRLRGDYTLIAGRYQGGTASAIYIIDAANQELIALSWDRTNNRINPLGHRSLLDDSRYLSKPR